MSEELEVKPLHIRFRKGVDTRLKNYFADIPIKARSDEARRLMELGLQKDQENKEILEKAQKRVP